MQSNFPNADLFFLFFYLQVLQLHLTYMSVHVCYVITMYSKLMHSIISVTFGVL